MGSLQPKRRTRPSGSGSSEGGVPKIIRPHLFESLDWLDCGMTTRVAAEPDEPRLGVAADLPALLGLEPVPVVVGEQVHGHRLAVVGSDVEDSEQVEPGEVFEVPGADGVVASEPGWLVGVFTADCVPVTLVDRRSRRVAVAHAGRKGTLQGIVPRALRHLVKLGSNVEDLLVWIGPSICGYHYEVSEEMAAEFRDHFSHFPGAIGGDEFRNLNLGVINWCQLVQAGLSPDRIELDARCTFEEDDLFYSYRRDGGTGGRMLTFAHARGEA